VTAIADAFAAVLAGAKSTSHLERALAPQTPQGLTEGSLFVSPGYLELPVLQ
jgi:hypothetical protein